MLDANTVKKLRNMLTGLPMWMRSTTTITIPQEEQKDTNESTYADVYHAVFNITDLDDFVKSFTDMLFKPSEKIDNIVPNILVYLYDQLKKYSKEGKTINHKISYMFPQISESYAVYVSMLPQHYTVEWKQYKLFQIDFATYEKEILLDMVGKLTEKYKRETISVSCEPQSIEKGTSHD